MKRFELRVYLVLLVVLSLGVLGEARANARLLSSLAISPAELHARLSRGEAGLQLVDVREDAGRWEEAHVPGAVALPGCDLARGRVQCRVATVLISQDGDRALFERCRVQFTSARNLAGGMDAWLRAGLPTDGGFSRAPDESGGGCL
jgi:rhodanese-related sulfurtransferase